MARLALDDAAWTSAWRHRSTGEKAFLALGLLGVAVTARQPAVAALVALVAVAVALAGARVPVRTYLGALAAPVSFVALSAVSVAVAVGPGVVDPLWSWGPVAVTRGTLDRAIEVSARSCAAMAALTLLATTTPVTDLLDGLRRLRVPGVVVDVAGLVYRMLFTLLDTARGVREAQSARLGYTCGRTARRSLGLLASSVLAQSFVRAHRLEAGLAGRGGGGSLRTVVTPRPVSRAFVSLSALLLSGLVAVSVAVGR